MNNDGFKKHILMNHRDQWSFKNNVIIVKFDCKEMKYLISYLSLMQMNILENLRKTFRNVRLIWCS